MIRIRIECINGDVLMLPLLSCYVKLAVDFMVIDRDRIQKEFFPEYRVFDLIVSFVEVLDDSEVF